jgi:hypothetical protein
MWIKGSSREVSEFSWDGNTQAMNISVLLNKVTFINIYE